jgi:hypothetical protein
MAKDKEKEKPKPKADVVKVNEKNNLCPHWNEMKK